MRCVASRRLLSPLALVALATAAAAQSWPTDFVADEIGAGWDRPTCITFADPANMLVAEKGGRLWNVRNGVKRLTPVIDLSAEVLDNGDRGLLTVLADLEWDSNGYIYLGYIVDPNGDSIEAEQESFGRIVRYTTLRDVNGDLVADPASRKALIGATWTRGIPSLHLSHSIGDMRFASDGSLFITTGDGAHYDLTDSGGHDPNGFGPGKFDASEDIGAFRSQSITSLAGKVLRIDPETGLGLPDNPYFTGNANDHESRVWATGLRNPFRFTLRPGTGIPEKLYIGDVGWGTYEEINHAQRNVENFGWPCFEGPRVESSYDNADPGGECDDPTVFTKPLWSFHHSNPGTPGFTSQCISGMQVYEGTAYPQKYSGRLFFCEYASDWIRTVRFVNGAPTEVELFGNNIGNPVCLIADPTGGDLIYVAIGDNAIRRIRYTNANHPPEIVATASPYYGPAPLTVTLDASGSTDPEGQPLSFLWDFGDGTSGTNAVETHVYPLGIDYTAKLTVTDVGGETATWTRQISVDNTPPVITQIVSPPQPSFYADGQLINFSLIATDAEDNAAGLPLAIEWKFDLVHDHHTHPSWQKLFGASVNWTAESEGHGTWYQVTAKVTDSRGLKSTQMFDLYDLDAHAEPHLDSVSDVAPRLGLPVEARAHLHYAGKGAAELLFDWGDGTRALYHPSHLQERRPDHLYAAPGLYTLRVTADDGVERETVEQALQIRPLHPSVAIFAPVSSKRWIATDEQWTIATSLATQLRALGYEAEIFVPSSQQALLNWMENYRNDALRDYLVLLDMAPALVYSGQDDGSPAEDWIEAGNGILWTGYSPFAWWIAEDGSISDAGASFTAADEVLDAATAGLCTGAGSMLLLPPAIDLPDLAPYTATYGVIPSRLGTGWSEQVTYADDGTSGSLRATDAVLLRNAAGGEYAQFLVSNANLPKRVDVLFDFLRTQLFVGRPAGPAAFGLLDPAMKEQNVPPLMATFTWGDSAGATSWFFELALDPEFTHPVHVAVLPSAAPYDLPIELRQSQKYWWRVTARNDFGTSGADPRTFTTGRAAHKQR